MKQLLVCFVFGALAGCATLPAHELDQGGSQIPVTEYIQPEDREKLQVVTQVTCELGRNFVSQDSNIASCKNKMRNEAAAMGGVLLLMEPEKQSIGKDHYDSLAGSQYCPNCVKLRGIVYAPKKM
jgi:hypothetical protein